MTVPRMRIPQMAALELRFTPRNRQLLLPSLRLDHESCISSRWFGAGMVGGKELKMIDAIPSTFDL